MIGGLPPVLTVHGDADNVVPYQHAVRLHEALDEAGVPNQIYTVPGGKHRGFGAEQDLKVQQVVFDFLKQHGVLSRQQPAKRTKNQHQLSFGPARQS